jgi:hypothetical protein
MLLLRRVVMSQVGGRLRHHLTAIIINEDLVSIYRQGIALLLRQTKAGMIR